LVSLETKSEEMEMSDLRMAETLRAAANYLRTSGWQQRSIGIDGGARCMAGALLSVTGEVLPFRRPESLAARLSCILGFGPTAEDMANWNDGYDRTVEEVLDRLESTALALEVRALAEESKAKRLVTAEALGV
jgi:hypothetical protein